jgi:uncharacterized protein
MMQSAVSIDRQALADTCREFGVRRLLLFGSALRDDFDPDRSDVDLLVEFAPGASKSLFRLIRLQNALSEMLGRQVDLTTPGSLSKYFRDYVLASAAVLYDAA